MVCSDVKNNGDIDYGHLKELYVYPSLYYYGQTRCCKIITNSFQLLQISGTPKMSSSEACLGLLRVSSEDDTKTLYAAVPENQEFLIKLVANGESLVSFSYILKKGRSLPYSVVLLGG